MDFAQFIAIMSQLAFGAAAWRLANALKGRVDNHETSIIGLERAS